MNSEQGLNKTAPTLCANGCGFFGTAATMNLCSKCYRDQEQADSARSAMKNSLNVAVKQNHKFPAVVADVSSSSSSSESAVANSSSASSAGEEPKVVNRCGTCRRKVGLTGIKCKCGITFCGTHRYPEEHDCTFDFKDSGRDAIAQSNPVIKADKIDRF